MRISRRKSLLSTVLLAPAAILASACGGSDHAAGPTGDAIASLAACSNIPGVPSARCGTVEVPLDRADAAAGTTKVAFAVVPRRDRSAPSAGTLMFNPGGPGAPTIGTAGETANMFGPLLNHRDLLLVDPRGTGRSAALECGAMRQDLADVFDGSAGVSKAIGACGRELGSRARMYGSAAVADDFEAVRARLGLDRLDLWGNSYGTYLMPVYAARHPEHVRSMVLSGAYPIDFDPWGMDRVAATRRAIGLVCARTHSCRGDAVVRDIAALATRLRHRPLAFTVAVGDQRFRARIDENTLAAMTYAAGNAYALGAIPAIADSGRTGDFAQMRRLVENDVLAGAYAVTHPTPAVDSLPQALATECHDFPRAFSLSDTPAVRRADYEQARGALDPRAFFPFSPAAWTSSRVGFEAAATCIEWPDDPSAARPIAMGTPMPDVPVLVISGDLDANTPTSAGRKVARQFEHATLAEIPNTGHVPTDGSPCAMRLGMRFIATTTAKSTACAGTGTPPPVTPGAPLLAADLAPVPTPTGTAAQRRALAVVGATATDMQQQAWARTAFGTATALRGGRYTTQGQRVRLTSVRVVRDASVSGELITAAKDVTGTMRLTGIGTPDGRLRVHLSGTGTSRVTGTLDRQAVNFTFGLAG
jgi:pimeloyl-ACP methyl ester carboxylesterase